MKYILLSLFFLSNLYANFNFGTCQGSGTFEQQIEYYHGDYEHTVVVGTIPVGIEGLHIELVSDKDVDIRLYAANGDKIVHWPYGILNKQDLKTKPYQDVNVTYSGYNGVDGQKGHEFIEISGATPTVMIMKAFGYKAGYATINYSWTGKEGCNANESGQGSFIQALEQNATSLVGTIPPNVNNVQINLTSDKDLDIQLYGSNGTAIVSWKPTGLLFNATKQSRVYKDMNITWSGYNGTNGHLGNEYITITPKTTEVLVMKVYGYEAGEAEVTYSWGRVAPVEIKMSKSIYAENESLVVNISDQAEDNQTWVGIYHVGDTNDWDNVVTWDWTHGNDSVPLDGLAAGEYEARLFYNNSFITEASVAFTVISPDEDTGTKQLILDSGYLWIDSYPTRFIEKSAYLHTLPFSGFTMNSNAGDNTMEPNYSLVYDNVWNEVQGELLKDLYKDKSNFLKIRIDFPGDFWDQSAWDKVTHNFVIMARVAKNLHYAGIIFDNEPYSDGAEKLINYKHGNEWFDVHAYRNPNHNFSEHVEKITQLFKGIMEAMVVEYPDIEVLFYHTPVNSHKKADTGINNHPVVVHVGLQRQHELWGPIFIGFKKGLSHNAKLHDMGEDYRLRTQEHFNDAYAWRKHTIATDATNTIDSSMYWTVPVEERASWEHDVNVNFMASNDPLHSDTYPEFDTTDKVSLEDIRTTLERSLEKADKYVVFYSRNTNDDPLDFMKDKASVDAAWYQMFEDVYVMPNIEK